MQILLSRTHAGPGRTVKQEQEEISPNHVQRINLISIHLARSHSSLSLDNKIAKPDYSPSNINESLRGYASNYSRTSDYSGNNQSYLNKDRDEDNSEQVEKVDESVGKPRERDDGDPEGEGRAVKVAKLQHLPVKLRSKTFKLFWIQLLNMIRMSEVY